MSPELPHLRGSCHAGGDDFPRERHPTTVSPGLAVGWVQPFLLPLTYDDSAGQKGIEGGGLLEEEVGEQHVEYGGDRKSVV